MENEISEEAEQDTQRGKYLTFYVADEVYALEICQVIEIISILPITPLPEFPEYIKGIVNLRGRVIPVMDMRLRLRKKTAPYDSKTCIIIIEIDNLSLGLIVDSVSEVAFIDDSCVTRTPELEGSSDSRYIKSIGLVEDNVWLILDCSDLLKADVYEKIAGVKQIKE